MSKTIIITGAAGNMGTAVTNRLWEEGHTIEATVGPRNNPDELNKERLQATLVNLLDEQATARYIEQVKQRHEQVDAAILLVGGFAMGDIAATDGALLDSITKSLLFRLAEIINEEGKAHGITAPVIVPSTLDTAINRQVMPDADFSTWVPLEEVGKAISFLLSSTGTMLREPVLKLYNQA